ncbi:MAG: hypothetical protein GC191_03520 [Azospirillum sp.]|nr:hypothetical protein [Azospirillum sp.]
MLTRSEAGLDVISRPPGRCRRRMVAASLLLAMAGAATTAGCSDRVLETGWGYAYFYGEPVPDPVPTPPVQRITGADPNYPNLAGVPNRPPLPPDAEERAERLARLEGDARSGHLAEQLLKEEAPALPEPLAVPPVPAQAPPPVQPAPKS